MAETKECYHCKISKSITEYGVYTDVRNGRQKLRSSCKSCRVRIENERHKNNPERRRQYSKKYDDAHKDEKREYGRLQAAIKRATDPQFQLKASVMAIPRKALNQKHDKFVDFLGCTRDMMKVWIEYQFDDNMSWENGKMWHLDHVIPVSYFDLSSETEQLIASHWSNLRPLLKGKNISKGNKILKDDIISHVQVVKQFIQLNSGYQTSIERCWWQRIDLWYGKNPNEDLNKFLDEDFNKFIDWIIRSQASQLGGRFND